MKTTKEIFNALYPEQKLLADVRESEKNHKQINDDFLKMLPYDLSDNYKNLLYLICKDVSFKAFSLGFSTATKLTAESFIKTENINKNPNDFI